MSEPTRITYENVELVEAFLGYDILVDGDYAGVIEGVPGSLDYIELKLHWEGQGVGRAAIQQFVALSRHHGESAVRTTNATSDLARMKFRFRTSTLTAHRRLDC